MSPNAVLPIGDELIGCDFVAMASRIVLQAVSRDGSDALARLDRAREIFVSTERSCSRFDPDSALAHVNRRPDAWHVVPQLLYRAVEEAKWAHDVTARRFDPRVLGALVALGYDRTLDFASGAAATDRSGPGPGPSLEPWDPGLRPATHEIRVGPSPIDLGGIGKGLAVRWAARLLSRHFRGFLVDAGGDCYASGGAPGVGHWRVGVEDPFAPEQVVAVLALRDRAVATSSVRHRRWSAAGREVHHLIDPRTGAPGGPGLVSVTVVGEDAARCEVWSKALFLEGEGSIAERVEHAGIAACWVTTEGALRMSESIRPYLEWRRA